MRRFVNRFAAAPVLVAVASLLTAVKLLTAVSVLAWPAAADAQAWPAKPLTWVVGFPAGGGADAVGRLVSAKVAQNIGQPILVENRPGASSTIAAQYVAQAPADGYTFFNTETGALVYNAALFAKLNYDGLRDFAPVSNMIRAPLLLVVHPQFAATDLKGLVEMAKKQPGKLNYASPGKGIAHHLGMEMFKMRAGIDITDIAYKGIGPAAQDVLAGQVPMAVIDTVVALQHVRAGKLRALAVFSNARLPILPDVPSMAEQGFADLDIAPIVGVVAPRQTPKEIVARMALEIARAVRDPEVAARLTGLGLEIVGNTPEQFGAYLEGESKRMLPVIRSLNIRLD